MIDLGVAKFDKEELQVFTWATCTNIAYDNQSRTQTQQTFYLRQIYDGMSTSLFRNELIICDCLALHRLFYEKLVNNKNKELQRFGA